MLVVSCTGALTAAEQAPASSSAINGRNDDARLLRTVIIAALTSTARSYPSRVECQFQSKAGQIALDHIRSVDKSRLVRKLGVLDSATAQEVCTTLQELFEY